LNVPEPRPFVLGGIVHGGDPRPIDLSPLRADLRIQASVKELKFEHIAWGDFPAILGSRRLAQFLSWLKAESYLIHFIAVDPLYFAFVDIIDSIPEARRLDFPAKLILKNDLYRVLRHDGEATLDLLRRYAFPAVDSRNVPRFMTELITLLEGSPELMPAFNQMMLKGILQAGRGLVSLPLLDDAPHVLMAGFDSMFTHRLCLFKASHHLLDDEDVVSKVLERYRFHDEGRALDFYRFVNSREEPGVQLSDVVVGLLGACLSWLGRLDDDGVIAFKRGLTTAQHANRMALADLVNRSIETTSAFVQNVLSLDDIQRLWMFLDD
jgi:hypothetical protein